MVSRAERNRETWANEAINSTPWLAQNLDALSNALDLDLEPPRMEVPVGPYFLDLFAMDARSDRAVVIENQLDQANHRHLGQILTYATGLGASVLIWIASDFTPEHLRVVDRLNEWAADEVEVYAVAVAGRLRGRSRLPVARFFVEAAPASKAGLISRAPGSDRESKYVAFFSHAGASLGRLRARAC